MTLSLRSRTIGDITVVTCDGAIVEGGPAAALRQHVNDVLERTPAIVLDLRDVHFIDSGGLGLLVRILARTGPQHLKLCGLSSRIAETLKITRLSTVFDCYESDADAIAAFYRPSTASSRTSQLVPSNVLCIEKSTDVLVYVQEVLRQAGLSVITTNNLPDAVMLLKAMEPKVVVVGHELRSAGGTGTVETFNRLLAPRPVVELPPDFGRQDPRETGQHLVERVRGLILGA